MQCGDEEVIVHRKGVTPAEMRVLGVTLVSTGLDEVPMAYKGILDVLTQ